MKTFSNWMYEKSEYQEVKYCESSLTRMMSMTDSPWAIITAYRKFNDDGTPRTKEENIQHNRELRSKLNSMKMGVHQLIGHWRECKDSNIPYPQCPENMKVDTVERSYFVPKPKDMDMDYFRDTLLSLGKEKKQDAILYSDGTSVKVAYSSGGEDVIGTHLGLNQIGQGYSQHILKQNVPFVFEGFEQLHGNYARQGAALHGLILPSVNESFKVIKAKLLN